MCAENKVRLTFFGTGTSQGVPIIGCRCPVCLSGDDRDKRLRASALVEAGGMKVLIDAGPDFRAQMLRAGIGHLDAILLTHNHKDHTGGLDDVRSLNYIDAHCVDIYCEPPVLDSLKSEYPYAFALPKYPGAPEWRVHTIGETPFRVKRGDSRELVWVHDVGYGYREADGRIVPAGPDLVDAALSEEGPSRLLGDRGLVTVPVRGMHGHMPVLGFRFGDIAYLTDMNAIPEEELDKLHGLEHLTLNTVGYRPHHSHFSLDEALLLAGRIGARHTWLTHLSHSFPVHAAFEEEIRARCRALGVTASVRPAFDGLVLEGTF